jgi:hypothetical protein
MTTNCSDNNDDEDYIDGDGDENNYISDHTRSMRNASKYCTDLFNRLILDTTTSDCLELVENCILNDEDEGENEDPSSRRRRRRRRRRQKFRIEQCVSEQCDINAVRIASDEHRVRRNDAHRNFWSRTVDNSPFDTTTNSDKSSSSCTTNTKCIRNPIIEIDRIDMNLVNINHNNNDKDNKNIVVKLDHQEQIWSFKDKFQNKNVPCLIKGLDRSSHFDFVNKNWRNSRNSNDTDTDTDKNKNNIGGEDSKVNRKWFLDELGKDFLVPLRYSPRSSTADINNDNDDDTTRTTAPSPLDEDGRAIECETREVTMKEWITLLDEENSSSLSSSSHSLHVSEKNQSHRKKEESSILYYLKDWHLQQMYPLSSSSSSNANTKRDEKTQQVSEESSSLFPPSPSPNNDDSLCSSCSLYSCPDIFGYDLLNSFLKKFTKGDYRFCYWGPARSYTAQHSDVLHSFSWSYNVVGTKEWTFFHRDIHSINKNNNDGDNSNNNDNNNTKSSKDSNQTHYKTFTVIQKTGDTMFVPATWQHQVVNIEETISINHNWITSSNLDLTWDCLQTEMIAVQKELRGWGDNGDDDDGLDQNMEACENMLRGCIGLDVTAFVLMTLVRVLEVITELQSLLSSNENDGSREENNTNNDECVSSLIHTKQQERLLFDVFRLTSVLRDVVLVTEPNLLQLRNRLKAVLQNDKISNNVEMIVMDVIYWVQ